MTAQLADVESAVLESAPGFYPRPDQARRIPVSDPRHFEIVDFMEYESSLLDDNDLEAWLDLLAADIVYRAPVRVTRENGKGEFETEQFHINETGMMLMLKVTRLTQTTSAWSENPMSRTQRIVHKVRAYETDVEDEVEVRSSILLLRSRFDSPNLEFLSARRIDAIRCEQPWEIASRTVYFDQSVLGVPNLTSYL